ncbi:MAG: DNA gyrase subunit A [Planctomycetota bacterium]
MTDAARGREQVLLIEEEMKDSYLSYAMSVIVSRALPDVRDGLKPSQRRVLVAMNDLNLGPRAKFKKCAKIAGDASGNYHPHGEAVVYPTLVRLAQDFNMRYRLVDGQGNFGTVDGDPPAAMRYTEARMTAAAAAMMEDLDQETVDTIPNYDGSRTEPTVLPSRFPNLLVNGSSGIAVGMATSIPPHNVREMCDGLARIIDHPDLTVDELMEIVKAPDFPTGGIICGLRGVREAYTTGRGLIAVRGRVSVEEVKKERHNLVITEIPYQVNKTALIEKMADMVKEERLPGISDIRDESDKDGMRIVIELKRGEDPDVVLNQMYKFTPLQDTFSIINIALVNGRPRTLPLKSLMTEFVEHRREVIRRRTRFQLRKAQERLHILEGYRIALDHIDEIIQVIKQSANADTAKGALVQRFGLSEIQSDAILRMQLQRLTGLERDKIEEEYSEVLRNIAYLTSVLADPRLVDGIIKEDLIKIRETFGDDRRTEIGEPLDDFDLEDLIVDEEVAITASHEGYMKRVAIDTYKSQRRGGVGITASDTKEGDFIEHLWSAHTKDYLLFFTDNGKVHWLKVHQIPELSRQSRGRAIANLLQLAPDEKITSVIPVRDFSQGDLVMVTKRGVVKKTALQAFSRPKKGGIIAISLDEADQLVGVLVAGKDDEVILGTKQGYAIRFPEKQVRRMGRPARGVIGIRLRDQDEVVGIALAEEGKNILTVCENGYGKRTELAEYRAQGRGGMGVINIRTTERNGQVVRLLSVNDSQDVMIITSSGMIVRTAVSGISTVGRATQGVKIIQLREEDRVASITPVVKEDAEAERARVVVSGEDPGAGEIDEEGESSAPAADEEDGGENADRPQTEPDDDQG